MGLTMKMKDKNPKPEQGLFNILLKQADQEKLHWVYSMCNPKFFIGFYNVGADVGMGEIPSVDLPVTVSSIMKGTATTEQLALARQRILELLDAVLDVCGFKYSVTEGLTGTTAMPSLQTIPKGSLPGGAALKYPTKTVGFGSAPGKVTTPATAQSNKQKVHEVIKLAEAASLKQRVKGTSDKSVYRVAALSDRVRVAVRFKSGVVSIRVEGNLNATEKTKLKALGMTDGGGYLSMHLHAHGELPQKIAGAILFGSCIKFSEIVTDFDDFPLEDWAV
jgi:hypothetical protein